MADMQTRMEKVRRLMDSPVPGEAAAARALYEKMQAKQAREIALTNAIYWFRDNGYAISQLDDGSLYVTLEEDAGRILFRGLAEDDLPAAAERLRKASVDV